MLGRGGDLCCVSCEQYESGSLRGDFLVWLIPNFTASKDFIKFYVLSLEYQLLVESNGVKLRDARHKK